jgi:hypothetical protein
MPNQPMKFVARKGQIVLDERYAELQTLIGETMTVGDPGLDMTLNFGQRVREGHAQVFDVEESRRRTLAAQQNEAEIQNKLDKLLKIMP